MLGEVNLWIEFLWVAAFDYHGRDCAEVQQRSAKKWFDSRAINPGSFLWVCNLLDVNSPELLRRRLLEEAAPRKVTANRTVRPMAFSSADSARVLREYHP
jgi:hypothetical protein